VTTPRVTIVTTVYDRMPCLAQCLRAMAHSLYRDYEQIVVSDAPPLHVRDEIATLVAAAGPQVRHLSLRTRSDDWGMTPAHAGLRAALGEYVCFLSDDNAYLPGHFGPLVAALDANPGLGFVYSSCQYAGRMVLREAIPRGSRIDLGQPLFRTALLRATFPTEFPFHEFAWDWRMIDTLVRAGARWLHYDKPTFIFRLAAYPLYVKALR